MIASVLSDFSLLSSHDCLNLGDDSYHIPLYDGANHVCLESLAPGVMSLSYPATAQGFPFW